MSYSVDPSTIRITPLHGTNVVTWKRQFKSLAIAKGVWGFFDGTIEIKDAPIRPTKPNAEPPRDLRDNPTALQAFREQLRQQMDEYNLDVQEYKLELAEYESNAKRKETAHSLLTATVNPSLRTLSDAQSPKENYDDIVSIFKLDQHRALDLAWTTFNRLALASFKSMAEFINALTEAMLDIKELKPLGWDFPDDLLRQKLLNGLTPDYDDFVRHFYMMESDPTLSIDLAGIFPMLLAEESRLKEDRRKKVFVRPNASARTTGLGNSRQRDRCTQCNKWGHNERDCWVAHPEKRPSPGQAGSGRFNRSGGMAAVATTDEKVFNMGLANSKDGLDKDKERFQVRGTPRSRPPLTAFTEIHPQKSLSTRMDSKGEHVERSGRFHLRSIGSDFGQCTVATDPNEELSELSFQDRPVIRNSWILDCGANMCICNDLQWFTDFHPFEMNVSMVDDSTTLPILGGGTVVLKMADGAGEDFNLTLRNVVYAPSSRCNLLSQSKLARAGIHGYWKGGALYLLSPQNQRIGFAVVVNGLYQIQLRQESFPTKRNNPTRPFAANLDFSHPVWKWHRRLGHLSLDRMQSLLKHSEGMNITREQLRAKLGAICPICATTRAVVRIPREPARRRFKDLGSLLHIDLWGPYNVPSWDNTRFFCFVTDDATRYTWSLRLKTRDEAPDALRTLVKRLQRKHDMTIRRTRVDNELNKGPWKAYATKKSITIEPTATYSHNQVGVAERANRTIREGASAMIGDNHVGGQVKRLLTLRSEELMRQSTIPEALWPEAVDHSVWLKNRAPTRARKDKKTPWEAVHSVQPDLSQERIWGSRCYVSYTEEERQRRHRTRKLHDPRGWLGYFVGIENEGTYRVWDPVSATVKTIMTARIDDGQGLDDDQDQQDYSRARNERRL
jgi:gag-polypeptide of LTR copia-type/GAG-pre-integrase domain